MTLPQIARAATTPNTEPSNCAATYGSIPAAGNTPNRHIANDIAGFVCPPLILPSGLLISPVSRTATPAPTISSSTWICGKAREIGEGPTTNLTIVVTPKSRREVRISSSALCRASSTKRDRPVAVILDPSECEAIASKFPDTCLAKNPAVRSARSLLISRRERNALRSFDWCRGRLLISAVTLHRGPVGTDGQHRRCQL